jgi:hypothetical protein
MLKEIFFCDLVVIKDKKPFKIEKCVWLEGETVYKRMEIKEVIKIKSLGFQANTEGFTTSEKSNEKRNNVTGAYE